MTCHHCGQLTSDDAHKCGQCGQPLSGHCPACAAELPGGARFCPACGRALPAPMGANPPGRPQPAASVAAGRKQLTILFADFSDFTAFAAQRDPEDVRDCLHTIWAGLDEIIAAHGGTPEKHSGDAVMAVFGGWQSREEDPAQAVRAALAMQAWLEARNAEDALTALQMRIGIHTGLVVVGPADHAGEFLATGDAVNLASRLEQAAPIGGVLISKTSFQQVFGLFDAQAMPPLTVKGKAEPLETYLIQRPKPRGLALQLRDIAGVETSLVGRAPELDALQAAFESSHRQRAPQLVMIVGEGGLGKSRLIHEFQKRLDLLPQHVRLFFGRATAEITGTPFAVIRDLFAWRFEIQDSDPAAVARDKFERGLAGLLALRPPPTAEGCVELAADIAFLGQLFGFHSARSVRLPAVFPEVEQIRQRSFQAFSRLLTALSQCPAKMGAPPDCNLLVVLEDLHWADPGSLDMIAQLTRHGSGISLLIVGSARPSFFERHPGWGGDGPHSLRLNLAPLSPSESDTLIGKILRKATEIPPILRELITEGTEGNPFYIEEMIKMLMDQKVIAPRAGQWQVQLDLLANARVPSTLTGVLQARLDSLAPAERAVLQRASVIGRVFWESAVEHMGAAGNPQTAPSYFQAGKLSPAGLRQALDGLRRKELVFPREASTFASSREYMFKHELLRAVAYESLLKKSRRQHHARVAEWLQQQGGDRLNEFAGQIATHLEQAAQSAAAAVWHGRAGQQAQRSCAPAVASGHFQKALKLLPPDVADESASLRLHLEWQEGLGDTLAAQARFAEAMEAYTAMRDRAHKMSDSVAEARACNGIAYLHERRGDNRASVQWAEQAEALAREAGDPGLAERVRALHFKGWACYRLGDAAAVLAMGNQTLHLSAAREDRHATAASYKLLGVAHLQLGQYAEADRFFEQGRVWFEAAGDQRNASAMCSNRGETARARGDVPAAAAFYEQALAIARQICHRESELIYLANLAAARVQLKQFAQAEAELRQVLHQTLEANSCNLSETCSVLSLACLGQGKFSGAGEAAQRALDLARESESLPDLGNAWRVCGLVGAASLPPDAQPPGTAATFDPPVCFAKSLAIFEQIQAEGEQARTLRAWGEYERQTGAKTVGRQKLQTARNIFQKLAATGEVAATAALLQNVT